MAYADIAAAIKTVIESASGTANVYDYTRFNSADPEQMKTLFQSGNVINTWQITRSLANAEFDGTGVCAVDRENEFTINGYYSIDDSAASEKTFQQLVNDVMDKLNLDANKTLSSNITRFSRPAQLVNFESVMYGSIGCWWCEIKIYPVETVATA